MRKNTNQNSKKPICAPLYIVKAEKSYCLWIFFVIFFGLLNIWAALFLGKNEDVGKAFDEGIIYTYSISILAPFIIEFLIKWLINSRANEENKFITYKVRTCFLNIILIVILTLLWLGNYRDKWMIQIILGLVSSVLAFYMYCIGQMDYHLDIVGEFDDDYLNNEKKRMEDTKDNAKKLNTMNSEEGAVEL